MTTRTIINNIAITATTTATINIIASTIYVSSMPYKMGSWVGGSDCDSNAKTYTTVNPINPKLRVGSLGGSRALIGEARGGDSKPPSRDGSVARVECTSAP